MNLYPIKQLKKTIFIILHPKAKRPPSPKNKHWTINIDTSDKNPASGPKIAASKTPPVICPLDPVPGIEKLIIWAANTNAPTTPINGILLWISSSFLILLIKK